MSKHIGIVACSAEGAALCYRTVVSEGIKLLHNHRHPEISMHGFALGDYMDHLADGAEDWAAVGAIVVESVDRLRRAGADFAICPDNTVHEGIDLIRRELGLPFLHIADVVAAAAKVRGLSRLLVLGTRYTARSNYYARALSDAGIEQQMPDPDEVAGNYRSSPHCGM